MNLHIVGGFLGSGKTTAIIGAARQLLAAGKRVGVVTNDQGKYLVDTAFVQLSDVPAVEVSGGCFCCRYDDLDARLEQLRTTARPDVIFAESVGSCADIVATVIKPLLALRADGLRPASFSVFADSRLLRRWLREEELPFSEEVVYIYGKQLEEAGLLIINKADLLPPADIEAVADLSQARFPGKPIRIQNSLVAQDVTNWLAHLESGAAAPPAASLTLDYARYGEGEARLAWLDQRLIVTAPEGAGRELALQLIEAVIAAIRAEDWPVGHLKFLVRGANAEAKVSFPTLDAPNWQAEVPALPGTRLEILINARVEAAAEALRTSIARAIAALPLTILASDVAAFHPGQPRPTHRF